MRSSQSAPPRTPLVWLPAYCWLRCRTLHEYRCRLDKGGSGWFKSRHTHMHAHTHTHTHTHTHARTHTHTHTHTSASAHGPPSHQTTLHQFVRVMPHDLPILTCPWFSLICIDHQILGTEGRETEASLTVCIKEVASLSIEG